MGTISVRYIKTATAVIITKCSQSSRNEHLQILILINKINNFCYKNL